MNSTTTHTIYSQSKKKKYNKQNYYNLTKLEKN